MGDDAKDKGLAWHLDRGRNVRQNRSEPHENVKVEGYTRADGKRVGKYTRRSPVR